MRSFLKQKGIITGKYDLKSKGECAIPQMALSNGSGSIKPVVTILVSGPYFELVLSAVSEQHWSDARGSDRGVCILQSRFCQYCYPLKTEESVLIRSRATNVELLFWLLYQSGSMEAAWMSQHWAHSQRLGDTFRKQLKAPDAQSVASTPEAFVMSKGTG